MTGVSEMETKRVTTIDNNKKTHQPAFLGGDRVNINCARFLFKNILNYNKFGEMKLLESVILAAFLGFALLQTVSAIKCWDCRSDSDPKCGDPFDNSTLGITDCSAEPSLSHLPPDVRPTMCRKIRQKSHGEWRYFRSCAYLGEPGIEGDERFCLMRTGSYNIFIEYCTCNSKDGCNSAGFLDLNRLTVVFATMLVSAVAWMLRL